MKRFFSSIILCVTLICQSFGMISVQATEAVTLGDKTEILAINNTSVEPADKIVQNEHWITEEQSLQIKGDYGEERKINFSVNAEEKAKYSFAIRCSIWRNSTTDNPELSVLVDGASVGKVMVPYDGNAVRANKLLDECVVGDYELTKGQHTVSISTNWGCDAYVQSIIIAKNDASAVTLGDKTEILAINNTSVEPADKIVQNEHWITEEQSLQIKGDYGEERKINFSVNAEEKAKYSFAIRCSIWRESTTDNPELSVLVDGASVGKVMVPYDGNAVRANKLLDECIVGTYELTKGQHTVSISTNWGCDAYVQSIIITKKGTESLSDGLVINAQNYSSATETTLKKVSDYYIDSGVPYITNDLGSDGPDGAESNWSAEYKISVSEQNAGLYKVWAVCNHWSSQRIEIKVSVGEQPIAYAPVSNVTTVGAEMPKIDANCFYFEEGEYTIKVEGISSSKGYFFRELSFSKFDCGVGNEQAGIYATPVEVTDDGKASISVTKLIENDENEAILIAALKKNNALRYVKIGEPVELEMNVATEVAISGLRTDLEEGESYTFYCFNSLNNLKPLTIAMNDGALLNELAPEARASDSELNGTYSFITEGGFRGVYCSANQYTETETIQKLKNSNVNTFIVYIFDRPHMDEASYKQMVSNWKAAIGDAKLITVVGYGSDPIYGDTQFGEFVDKTGLKIKAPCPMSEEYWNKVYGERAKWSKEAGAIGSVVDLEMYNADQTHFTSDRKCYCDDCWNDFCDYKYLKDASKLETIAERVAFLEEKTLSAEYNNFEANKLAGILGNIRESLPEDFMLGYMLYFQELQGLEVGLGTPTAPALVFDEYTYFTEHDETNIHHTYNNLGHIYGHNDPETAKPVVYLPGFWPQKYRASEQKEFIESIMNVNHKDAEEVPMYPDGYWIWCMGSLMHTEDEAGYSGHGCMTGENPEQYIETLKDININ